MTEEKKSFIPEVKDNTDEFTTEETVEAPAEEAPAPEMIDLKEKPPMSFSFACPICHGQLHNQPFPEGPNMDLYFVSAGPKGAPALQKITPSYASGVAVCMNCEIQFGYAAMFHLSLPDKAVKLNEEQLETYRKQAGGCGGCASNPEEGCDCGDTPEE